ncbi:MAG: alpha/beta fold hydrolase [Gaiellaceae bacterium]
MAHVIFLPGIIMPAALRYAPLLRQLDGVVAIPKDLEVYARGEPLPDYAIDAEIAGIAAAADDARLARFHLYGHSGGGACALAFAAAHPERVLSLAVDEPATDFSAEDRSDPYVDELAAAQSLPGPEAIAAFMRLQVAPDVQLPPRPEGPPPPWMATRPAGIRAFLRAIARHRVDPARYEAFTAPVLYTHGSSSHPRWTAMRARLARRFPDYSSELFDGLHHLNTSHQAEPERTAALLRAFWARAEGT